MCQTQEAVRELDQNEQLTTKRGHFGPVGKHHSQATLEGLGCMWGGGTFQGVFQVYKEHGPEAKQSSDPPETSAQKNPPEKQIYVATQKGTHTLKTMLGTEHVGMWYVLCPETQMITHMQGTDISELSTVSHVCC